MKNVNDTLGKSDLVKSLGGINGLTGIAGTASSALSGLINPSGNTTGVSSALQGIGTVASNIPGIGGLIGSGVNMLGGIVNAGFGSNIDSAKVNQIENLAKDQAAFMSSANDNDSLLSDWGSHTDMSSVSKSDIGSEGWFSNKATNKARELNKEIAKVNMRAWQSLGNTASNVDANNDMLMMANFAADGGSINIKPENRGKFTELKERTGKSSTWYKEHGTPEQRKMAVFALNARKWKHADGGWLGTGLNDNIATGLSFLPVVGTIMDCAEFINDPSLENLGWFVSGLASDIFTGGAGRTAIKAAKLARNSKRAAEVLKARRISSALNRGNVTGFKSNMKAARKADSMAKAYKDEMYKNIGKGVAYQSSDATLNATQQYQKKALGGPLTHGGVFDNGVTFIGTGGTHEENPFEGVQMGVDNEGVPNLVEEGEVIFNDYVFSKRMKVPKRLKKALRLKGDTFADAAKNISRESEERPNDPISKRGLESMLGILASGQEEERIRKENMRNNSYACGGKMGRLFEGTGDKPNTLHKYPNYTPLKDDSFYTPEYMRFWNWYRNNSDTDAGRAWLDRINNKEFGTVGGNIFKPADIVRLSHDYKKGPVHNAFTLAARQYAKENPVDLPDLGDIEIPDTDWDKMADDISKENLSDLTVDKSVSDITPIFESVKGMRNHPLRYAPIVGAGIAVANDLFGGNEPDYSNADLFAEAVRDSGRPIGTRPIGNYLPYEPLDRMFYINQLNKNAASGRRAIQNTAGGNRAAAMAGVLSADSNYSTGLGNMARQAEEYNRNLQRTVADFNRQTDMFNSQQGTQVDMFNSNLDNSRAQLYGNLANMRQNILNANRNEKAMNLTNFIQGLGDLGREMTDRDMLRWMADNGTIVYNPKGEYTGYRYSVAPKKNACGGRIKRKKGITL